MLKDVVGQDAADHLRHHRRGGACSSRSTSAGWWTCRYIARLYGKPEETVVAELGDLIYRDPETKAWQTADEYLSGNVRAKLAAATQAGPGTPATPRPSAQSSPKTCCRATSTPTSAPRGSPPPTSRRSRPHFFGVAPAAITVAHAGEGRGVERRGRLVGRAVGRRDGGLRHAAGRNGIWLLDLALNMKTPVIYDPTPPTRTSAWSTRKRRSPPRRSRSSSRSSSASWVFADPDRTERLVRLYNDTLQQPPPPALRRLATSTSPA